MTKRWITLAAVLATITFCILNLTAHLPPAHAQAASTEPPSRTPRPRPQATGTLGQAIVIIEQDTQLFAQPDNTSEILFDLNKGDGGIGGFARLLAMTRDQRWYQIQLGSTTTGWIVSSAARVAGGSPGTYDIVAFTPTPAMAGATPTLAPLATERMVGAYPIAHFHNPYNVHSGASFFYPIIGVVVVGQSAEVLATTTQQLGQNWYLIRYENGAGWVSGPTEDDIQGDLSNLPNLTPPPEPTQDGSSFITQPPNDLLTYLPSPTAMYPASTPMDIRHEQVADMIEVVLEPDLPLGAYAAAQLYDAASAIGRRIAQYPVTDYSVDVDADSNSIHVRFVDNFYRDEIIWAIQQEGLFEFVDFSDQSLELRTALLYDTLLTSGLHARENLRLGSMIKTYDEDSIEGLYALGFSFSTRRRNILNLNQPFTTIAANEAVAGASMVSNGTMWDVSISLSDSNTNLAGLSGYPRDRFIALTMDGQVLAIPFAGEVVRPTFGLDRFYDENEARRLVVLLRSGALPFAMRPRTITYIHNE